LAKNHFGSRKSTIKDVDKEHSESTQQEEPKSDKILPKLKIQSRFKSPQTVRSREKIEVVTERKSAFQRKETFSSVSSRSDISKLKPIHKSPLKRSRFDKWTQKGNSGKANKPFLEIFSPMKIPLSSRYDKNTKNNYQGLNKWLEDLENKVLFSPQMHKWKSLKVNKMNTLQKPYRLKGQNNLFSPKRTLKVINLQTIDKKDEKAELLNKSWSAFPKIGQVKKLRNKIEKESNNSQDNLEISRIKEISENFLVDAPVPFFKSQYSIGQKWIPYKRQGKMAYLKGRHKSPRY